MIVYALLTLKLGIATRTYQIGSEPWISNMWDQNFVLSYKNQFFDVAPSSQIEQRAPLSTIIQQYNHGLKQAFRRQQNKAEEIP